MSADPARLRPVAAASAHPDLQAADAAAARYSAAATPPNTARTYTSAWTRFQNWCAETGLTALPADPRTVERYLALGADRGEVAASTLGVWVAAIAHHHRQAGHPDPTADAAVRAVMQGVRAEHTAAARAAARAPAATRPVLTAMITTAHTGARTWRAQVAARRDIAVLALGFAAARRRSELAGLTVADLSLTRGSDGERLVQVRLRGTKTSRTAFTHLYLPRGRGADALCCPWCALHRWLVVLAARDRAAAREQRRQRRHGLSVLDQAAGDDAAAIAVQRAVATDTADPHTHRCTDPWPEHPHPETPLFRPLARGGWPRERALTDRQIARIIQSRGAAAGYPDLRGHSLRAGAATEAHARGARLEDIMALGGWANPSTALAYDRDREQRSARVDLGL
ncbi:tyrosine-type recombinase/integrase [Nocardia farcinica]|uniref:tyrosine-type recombinase/integrase n=1 Tax=Nocardia farcinica TaxID=37329 RepID=UPI0024586C3A|nr:tyrosine-type recombinase/integrase [Nocardia farcinica]